MSSNIANQLLNNKSKQSSYIYLSLITGFYITCTQISYILAYKMVPVGFAILPAGVLVFPVIYTLADVVTEVYGYQRARRMLWEAALCGLFFVLAITLLLKLPSQHAKLYEQALGKVWRIYFAVFVGVTTGSFINIYIISKWKIMARGRFFWFRSFISTAIGDAAITIIVDFIAFIGTMSFSKVVTVVLSIYLFKVFYAFCASIPAAIAVNYLKKAENSDVYDYITNFNPFKVAIEEKP